MDNIVLIGMPGVGKSTVGVILAKILGYQFLDTDLLIQKSQGKLLKDIIREKGTNGFIGLENQLISKVDVHHSVIATGGSVVYGRDAMEHLKEIGVVVYLKQNLWHLKKRLRNIKGRGVVLRKGQTLDDLFKERTVLYEKYADITIDEHGLSVEETINAVNEALAAYKNKKS